MSAPGNEKASVPQSRPEDYYTGGQSFPPPPPGPPPNQQAQVPPQHSNEAPLPDHSIPAYNPAHPQFAPPPVADDGMYDYPEQETQAGTTKPQAHGGPGHASKPSWSDRLSTIGTKVAAPLNALANKMGSEGFLPSTMDKEVVKAARILKNFCKDGVYTDSNAGPPSPAEGEHAAGDKKSKTPKNRTLLTIPSKVISRAVGLAIFTTGRVGFQVSGATGSGVLIARLPDGSWSPPSGIQVHSLGAGFVMGVDIYDCVVIINSRDALEAFKQMRASFGSDLAVVAGPWGAGGSLDIGLPVEGKGKDKEAKEAKKEEHKVPAPAAAPAADQQQQQYAAPPERKPSPFRQALSKPTYSYVKSRGFYAGVQIDGTVVTERKDANAAFYGAKLPVDQILKGQVPAGPWQTHVKELLDVVKGAEALKPQDAAAGHAPVDGTHLAAPPAAGSHVPAPGTGVHTGAHSGPDVAAGMQQMHLGGSQAAYAPPPTTYAPHPTAPAAPPAQSGSKAQEAAAESAAQPAQGSGPPGYSERMAGEEMPPAYVDDGQVRPSDSKTG